MARNKLSCAAALITVMATAVGIATTAWQANLAARERDAATEAKTAAESEAEHARIEANSALRLADVLIDSFLISAPRRTEAELQAVRHLLERHVQGVRREHDNNPHLRANLLDALGRVYLRIDLFAEAESLIREAAGIREPEFGINSLEYALSLGSLGELAYRQGDLPTAAEHFRNALALHRSLPRGVHTDVAQAANNLGVALRLLGSAEEAHALHREALALRRAGGVENQLVAESLNNLSAIHLDRGELDDAEQLLEQAPRHPSSLPGREPSSGRANPQQPRHHRFPAAGPRAGRDLPAGSDRARPSQPRAFGRVGGRRSPTWPA